MKGKGSMDTSSNEIWKNADCCEDWELTRPLLFREDMRETFFNWFKIKDCHRVLDGGCATGVLTRFIAKGLDSGSITGFDINQGFVDYGNKKIAEQNLSSKAKIVLEDGFALSFPDNSFDAVVNHTYLGVLSDCEAGLRELIRVCKTGGRISASVSARDFPGIHFAGDSPFEGEARLKELCERHEKAYRKNVNTVTLKQDTSWSSYRYPKLFSKCGLTGITIHPYASGFSYSDSYFTDEFKQQRIKNEITREIELLQKQQESNTLCAEDFSSGNFDELIKLYRQKQDYLLSSAKASDSWEWEAKMHLIVTGIKA